MAFDFPNSPTLNQQFVPVAGGPSWQWNGSAWVSSGGSSLGMQIIERVYLSSGTWTQPAGMLYLEVEIQSAGGGGGGCALTSTGQLSAGGGGGAGPLARQLFNASDLGATVAYTIGASGTGGPAGANNGTTAGTSSFSTLSASGGVLGGGSIATTVGAVAGGAGGVVSGGSVAAVGERGLASYFIFASNIFYSGAGGNSTFGSGGQSNIGGSSNGNAGTGYGAGGSGGSNTVSQAARPGGDGSPAFIKVREYYSFVGSAPAPGTIISRVLTTSGTWTKPNGCIAIDVEVQGSGGGGGASNTSAAGNCSVSPGGGGGGYAKKVIANPPASATITVAATAANGAAGGTSSYNDGTNTVTGGGGGGGPAATVSTGPILWLGGAGGIASGGDINISGDIGGTSQAVTSSTANFFSVRGGAGGKSMLGMGSRENAVSTTSSTGTAGLNAPANGYGGGGGGAFSINGTGSLAGGTSSQGAVIITEYY